MTDQEIHIITFHAYSQVSPFKWEDISEYQKDIFLKLTQKAIEENFSEEIEAADPAFVRAVYWLYCFYMNIKEVK